MTSARGAVRLLAGVELRRNLWALLALAVFAGLVGSVVIGAASLARRSSSAFDRLADATHLEDARLSVFGPAVSDEQIESLPGVAEHARAMLSVGRIEGGGLAYTGIAAGPALTDGTSRPVVLEGVLPDADASDEVAVIEDYAAAFGVGAGDVIPVRMLTSEEVGQFDVGFGDPDGPAVDLKVTAVVRVVPGEITAMPVLATQAFAARYGDEVGAGTSVSLWLADGASIEELAAEIERRNAQVERGAGTEEFLPFELFVPDQGRDRVAAAGRVLVAGLVAFAIVAATVGLLVLGQALFRRAGERAGAQRIESALGLTTADRVTVRVLPAIPAGLLAGALALAGGVLAAGLEPAGKLATVEPDPGRLLDPLVIVVGAAATGLALVGLVALAAWRSGRPGAPRADAGLAASRLVTGGRRPELAAGASFALASGRGSRSVPVRTAVSSTVLGVAGLVAALTFASSLGALERDAGRWGWPGAISVVDVTPEMEAELAADPRVDAAGLVDATAIVLEGATVPAVSLSTLEGEPDWTVIEGRLPAADDEVALGTRVATDLDADVGGEVTARGPDGAESTMRVVGIALAPPSDAGPLGDDAIVTPSARQRLAQSEPFREAIVALGADVDPTGVVEEWGARWEVLPAAAPAEVQNLADLGSLPAWLGVFLAGVGLVALAHALVVTVRRRGPDFAVLRTLGFTAAQVRRSLVGMALTTTTIGVVVGIPLGLAVGRLAWWVAATDAGVGPVVDVPALAVGLTAAGAFAGAIVLAVVPGRLAARTRPARLLQAE